MKRTCGRLNVHHEVWFVYFDGENGVCNPVNLFLTSHKYFRPFRTLKLKGQRKLSELTRIEYLAVVVRRLEGHREKWLVVMHSILILGSSLYIPCRE